MVIDNSLHPSLSLSLSPYLNYYYLQQKRKKEKNMTPSFVALLLEQNNPSISLCLCLPLAILP